MSSRQWVQKQKDLFPKVSREKTRNKARDSLLVQSCPPQVSRIASSKGVLRSFLLSVSQSSPIVFALPHLLHSPTLLSLPSASPLLAGLGGFVCWLVA